MTVNYVTAKLRKDKFRPLLDAIENVAGMKAKSENNLIGGCVFFTYLFMMAPMKEGKTMYQQMNKILKRTEPEAILGFMSQYYEFLKAKDPIDFFQAFKQAEQKK